MLYPLTKPAPARSRKVASVSVVAGTAGGAIAGLLDGALVLLDSAPPSPTEGVLLLFITTSLCAAAGCVVGWMLRVSALAVGRERMHRIVDALRGEPPGAVAEAIAALVFGAVLTLGVGAPLASTASARGNAPGAALATGLALALGLGVTLTARRLLRGSRLPRPAPALTAFFLALLSGLVAAHELGAGPELRIGLLGIAAATAGALAASLRLRLPPGRAGWRAAGIALTAASAAGAGFLLDIDAGTRRVGERTVLLGSVLQALAPDVPPLPSAGTVVAAWRPAVATPAMHVVSVSLPTPPQFEPILALIHARHYQGRETEVALGLRILERTTGKILWEEHVRGDAILYPSSAIKTLVALALLRRLDLIRSTRPTDLESALQRRLHKRTLLEQLRIVVPIWQWNANRPIETWWKLPFGTRVTVNFLFEEMLLTFSNNIAANQLIDIAIDHGPRTFPGSDDENFISDTAQMVLGRKIDPHALLLAHKFYNEGNPGAAVLEPYEVNAASTRGFVEIYDEIATGRRKILSEESRRFLIESLRRQTTRSKLNRYILEPEFHHKSGDSPKATADAGFFFCGGKIIIVAVMQNFKDKYMLQAVGKSLFEVLSRSPLGTECAWKPRERLPPFKLKQFERGGALRVLNASRKRR
jgi:hypothetical protein